ncbi:MAG: hypothetical protein N2Z22_02575 [Turneriella sp.]|nr:hypothetical protein [Leptospiraceae bacterium]MCX7632201.1 hypothetical protein [Turneriella sp.]
MAKDRHEQNRKAAVSFPQLLKLYLNEKTQKKALALAQKDLRLLEKLVQFETVLASSRRGVGSPAVDCQVPLHQVVGLAEKFFDTTDPYLLEKELKASAAWQTIKNSPADFALFQDVLSFLFTLGERPVLPTPPYLKQIVLDKIYAAVPQTAEPAIVIRLREGLRLIAGHLEGLFPIATADDMVPVRSAATVSAQQPTGVLQFLLKDAEQGKMIYQIVKDGKDTVMLTIKLQDYHPRPKFINLRRQGRLLQSLPLRDDFAWFPQLAAGKYELELQNGGNDISRRVNIHIV